MLVPSFHSPRWRVRTKINSSRLTAHGAIRWLLYHALRFPPIGKLVSPPGDPYQSAQKIRKNDLFGKASLLAGTAPLYLSSCQAKPSGETLYRHFLKKITRRRYKPAAGDVRCNQE